MERIAKGISHWFLDRGYILEEQEDQLRFGLEVFLSNGFSFLTILLIGFLLHRTLDTFIYVCVFIILRTYDDHYHADTFLKCYLLTVGTYVAALSFSIIILGPFQSQFILLVVLLNLVLLLLAGRASLGTVSSFLRNHYLVMCLGLMIVSVLLLVAENAALSILLIVENFILIVVSKDFSDQLNRLIFTK